MATRKPKPPSKKAIAAKEENAKASREWQAARMTLAQKLNPPEPNVATLQDFIAWLDWQIAFWKEGGRAAEMLAHVALDSRMTAAGPTATIQKAIEYADKLGIDRSASGLYMPDGEVIADQAVVMLDKIRVNLKAHVQELPIDATQAAILCVLLEAKKLLIQAEIMAGIDPILEKTPDGKTLRAALDPLETAAIIERPKGRRKGYRLTKAGKVLAAKHAAV